MSINNDPHYQKAVEMVEAAKLRDQFAMAALIGFAKNYRHATGYTKGGNVDKGMQLDAQLAYGLADAMMKAQKAEFTSKAIQIESRTDSFIKLQEALKDLVRACPTSITCEDVSHNRKSDLHGAEEDCPPLCRYYKALDAAQTLLSEI